MHVSLPPSEARLRGACPEGYAALAERARDRCSDLLPARASGLRSRFGGEVAMARTTHAGVELRTATADDVDALIAVFADLEGAQSNLLRRGRNIASARDGEATREGFLAAIADPHRRVILALHGGVAAGFALLAVVPSSSLVHEPSVRIDPLVVSRGARRRGVGRLLMGAAAAYAEEHGATTLTVAVRPGDRDGNRHFSRLGFAPVEVRRVAPVAAVRRAIAMPRGDVVVPLAPALRRRHTRELRRERAL